MIIGNAVYFGLMSHLPAEARHAPNHIDLGLAVDFWFCLVVYGVIGMIQQRRARDEGLPGRR